MQITEIAAERDRLKAISADLLAALEMALKNESAPYDAFPASAPEWIKQARAAIARAALAKTTT